MSHELEISENGEAKMFWVGETPWHGLGTKLESAPTTREAIVAAGLDWQVEERKLITADGALDVPAKALVRATDERVLGVVGPGWTPLQNDKAFDFFDPFLATGEAKLETAGSLRGGQRIWILALLNLAPSEVVKGDEIRKYVLLSNSHDGSLAVRVGFTPVRVVCANTEAMAISSAASKLLRIRHTKNVVVSLEKVGEIMNTANQNFEATIEQYRRLARLDVTEESLKKYVNLVFAPKRVERAIAEKAAAAGFAGEGFAAAMVADAEAEATAEELNSRIFPRVRELFETGSGNQLPGVRGTAWAAYNAITEYLGRERGKDAERRLDQLWFGAGAKLNSRALKVGIEMADAA
jgi:phage/plasmid-like protein (TIGR03299 family)